jgi:hypothetical protein
MRACVDFELTISVMKDLSGPANGSEGGMPCDMKDPALKIL